MTALPDRDGLVARWARRLVPALILVPTLALGLTLDRLPKPQIDDPVLNLPAANAVRGRPFAYKWHPDLPHGDRVAASHDPLFPRLQLATFGALGVSHFAARAPSFAAGQAAVGLLAAVLLARGAPGAALLLAAGWLADPVASELRSGRMEGLGLLALALAWWAWTRAWTAPRARGAVPWALGHGAAVGVAVGFHPPLILTAIPFLIFWLCLAPADRRWWAFPIPAALGGAGAALAAYSPWLLSPDREACLEQFRWFLTAYKDDPALGDHGFGWLLREAEVTGAPELLVGLFAAAHALPLAALVWGLGGRRIPAGLVPTTAATVAALAGALLVIAFAPKHPYYWIYLNPWIYALAGILGGAIASRPWPPTGWLAAARRVAGWGFALGVAAAALGVGFERGRRLGVQYPAQDATGLVEALAEAIPPGATVHIHARWYPLATRAGLDYEPLYWDRSLVNSVPADRWILMDDGWNARAPGGGLLTPALDDETRRTHPLGYLIEWPVGPAAAKANYRIRARLLPPAGERPAIADRLPPPARVRARLGDGDGGGGGDGGDGS